MSNTYNADLQNNNTVLQSILDTINNLPEQETLASNITLPLNFTSTGVATGIIYYLTNENGEAVPQVLNFSKVADGAYSVSVIPETNIFVLCDYGFYGITFIDSFISLADTILSGTSNITSFAYSVVKVPADAIQLGLNVSCFIKGTNITLFNKTSKKVENITYQDDLLVWDFDNGCYSLAKPLWIKKSEITTEYYHLIFDDNTELKVVGGRDHAHRIFSLNTNKFEYANDCVGHKIQTLNGEKTLLSCDIIKENVEFYNIITDYYMNLFANSILTSTGLNNLYPIEDMKFVKENRELIPIEQFNNCPIELYKGLRLGEQVNYTMERLNEKIE